MKYGYEVDLRRDYTDEMEPADAWRALWTIDEKDFVLNLLLNWMHNMPMECRMWHSDSFDEDILLFDPERIPEADHLEEDWRRCEVSLQFLKLYVRGNWNIRECPNSRVLEVMAAVDRALEDVRRIIKDSEEAGRFPSAVEAWDAEEEEEADE